jgi:hypothetical protein
MRNSFGDMIWGGKQKLNNIIWTDKQTNKLNYSVHRNDGIFLMREDDFLLLFDRVNIRKINARDQHRNH